MKELMKFLMEVTEGIPGAIDFATATLAEAQKGGDEAMLRWLVAFQRAKVIGVTGSKLYNIWVCTTKRNNKDVLDYLINESAASIRALAEVFG